MGINIPDGNQNKFFGQKVSKAGKNVYNASDNDLIYKNDLPKCFINLSSINQFRFSV